MNFDPALQIHIASMAPATAFLPLSVVFGVFYGGAGFRTWIKRIIRGTSQGLGQSARESLGVLQTFYEHAPSLLGVVELVGSDILHVYDNPAAARFLGVSPGETGGRLESALGVDANQTAQWHARYQESLKQRTPVRFEFKNAAGRWFAVTVCPVIERGPQTQQYCFLAEDISEWKNNAEQAFLDRERLCFALKVGKLAFWDWDIATGALYFGGEWLRLLEYPTEQLTPTISFWRGLVHPDDVARTIDAMQDSIAGISPECEIECRLKTYSANWLWVTVRGRVIDRDTANKAVRYAAVIEDVHQQRETREELKRIASQKDEFLAILAHELRNPLAPIRTGLQIIKRDPTSDVAAQARDMMDRQLAHMVRLIDDLLDVSRISLGRLELKKTHLTVRTIIDTAQEGSIPFFEGHKHSFTVHIPEDPIVVFGDLTRLAQVVSNLINNAAKYTPDGGHIDVRVIRQAPSVLIQVQDDGVGIPHEMLTRIFDMFGQVNQTLNRAQGGLGIGLALVKKIVELHEGTVKAESHGSNQGTTFTVTLPIDLAGTEQSSTVTSAPDETKNHGQKVLVIDDNIDGAESLSIFLQMSGYATTVANSATAGLKLVDEFLPDIVLLDIGLPEMPGYEVARHIRAGARGKDIFIVALTGWGAEKDKEAAKAAGFNAHLTKPVDLDTLCDLLKRRSDAPTSIPTHLN